MSDSYPLVFPLLNWPGVGGSEGSLGIGPSFDFDAVGATSIVCHIVGNCASLDPGKSITFRIRTTNDVSVSATSRTLLTTLPALSANGLFSLSATIAVPAGALQWLVTAQTDSVTTPTLSDLTLIVEVLRSSSSRYPALLGAFQSSSHIFATGSESFDDGGSTPFSPIVDFSKLGPKFQMVLGATTGSNGSVGRARIRIGGTYNTIDGALVVDAAVSAASFRVWAVRAVVNNIWSSPQPLKVTGISGLTAIGPTLIALPW
jgi:hypothetical protein